jgi:hypothetical protein
MVEAKEGFKSEPEHQPAGRIDTPWPIVSEENVL